VTALGSAFQSRRGGWADDLGSELVSCDDDGSLRVWLVPSSSGYMATDVAVATGAACCSLAVRRGFIVAAGVDGTVRIYNTVSACVTVQSLGHSTLAGPAR
jgi:WD40 repeat protein